MKEYNDAYLGGETVRVVEKIVPLTHAQVLEHIKGCSNCQDALEKKETSEHCNCSGPYTCKFHDGEFVFCNNFKCRCHTRKTECEHKSVLSELMGLKWYCVDCGQKVLRPSKKPEEHIHSRACTCTTKCQCVCHDKFTYLSHGSCCPDYERPLKKPQIEKIDLREQLAELEHAQWTDWSKELAATEEIDPVRRARWKKLWRPYAELTEEEKDHDRKYADYVIALVRKLPQEGEVK